MAVELQKKIRKMRERRARRVRSKIFGTAARPRISVFRSNRAIYVQFIDDEKGHTLLAFSSKKLPDAEQKQNKTAQAMRVGEEAGKLAKEHGIVKAVFDRGSYRYHGRVKALAEGIRKAGIQF
ncbi:50S ribosomal protein L18 [Candidatus Parcubacteria bacterium]|nr:MAG: 50S ribosomal protein L18 [Candidatus Parcubacteria bacterium]